MGTLINNISAKTHHSILLWKFVAITEKHGSSLIVKFETQLYVSFDWMPTRCLKWNPELEVIWPPISQTFWEYCWVNACPLPSILSCLFSSYLLWLTGIYLLSIAGAMHAPYPPSYPAPFQLPSVINRDIFIKFWRDFYEDILFT